MKYKVFVTDAYMVNIDGVCEWANEVPKEKGGVELDFEQKKVEEHNTVEQALKSMDDWGSKWAMYSGVTIENKEGEEVYSDLSCLNYCEHCKHEEYDRITGGLYVMKNKDGSKLFPEII